MRTTRLSMSARTRGRPGRRRDLAPSNLWAGQNGFGLSHHRHFPESLSPESVGNLGQGGLFTVGQQQTALDLHFENAVLGSQILVPQQELLIDRSCDVGEHACPNHLVASPPIAKDRSSSFRGRTKKLPCRGNRQPRRQQEATPPQHLPII